MLRHNEHGQPVGPRVPGWLTRPVPGGVPLRGRHVLVDPLVPAHAGPLFAALVERGDDALWTYSAHGPFTDKGEFTSYVDGLASATKLNAMVLATEAGPGGVACFMRLDPANGSVEVGGIVLAPALQRTRAATEAMYLMARHVFADLGYRRYEWKCDALNAPSRSAAERLGFQFEGVFRNAVVYKGRSRDTAWYAMTDEDWPAVAKAFQRWLDPANFDADGRQRASLATLRGE